MKRVLDVVLAAGGLIVSAPLMLAAALAIRLVMGKPVVFTQCRAGLHGRVFKIFKFRTMNGAEVTPLGRFLRETSVDELPQLWNVFRGDMSLVGPRPLLAEYLPRYNTFQARRHEVRPGITGWAQVQGRNALDWNRKFALDVWYVDHRSLKLDIRILLMTAAQMVRRGRSAAEFDTIAEFPGNS